MTLPTDPTLLDPTVATPAQHRSWHETLHAFWAESPAQPTSIPAGSTGNLAAHDALEALVGAGLPTSYAEDDPGHTDHHRILHYIYNGGGTATTTLAAGSNIQAALTAGPTGQTFLLQPGTYRLTDYATTALNPKTDQKLIGINGAVITGSTVLSTWTPSGSDFFATRATGTLASQADNGRCSITGCENPNDVFYDGVPLVRVNSQAALAPGKFYEDFAAGRVYIRDNPTGHLVEQAVVRRLIQSSNSGIKVLNLTLQHAANQYQQGAVEADGTGWLIEHCDVRYNHGYGVRTDGTFSTVRRNHVHHNGQLGIGGSNCDDSLIEENEDNHNNRDGAYSWGNEAGGSKWSLTDRLTVRGNYVHDNIGAGLWTDINNGETLYENNYVVDNTQYGIFHEVSYSAIIRNNVSARNAPNSTTGFYSGGQIVASASRDVEIYGNTVRGRDTIGGMQQNRTDDPDPRGAHEIWNLYVHDNAEETLNNGGWHLLGGIVNDDAAQNPGVWDSRNNRFQNNTYYSTVTTGGYWEWHNGARSFTTWQTTYGMDTAATFTAGTVTLPSPPSLLVGPQP